MARTATVLFRRRVRGMGGTSIPPAHDSLTWITDEFDTTPQWDIGYTAGNIIADDVLEIDVCSDAGFTTREVLLQHTITSGEISGGTFSFTAGSALTLGDKYSRSRTVRGGIQGPWTSCTTLPKTLVASNRSYALGGITLVTDNTSRQSALGGITIHE